MWCSQLTQKCAAAQVGDERDQAAVQRAKAEVIPNLNFYTGYIRQYENQSHDFAVGVNGVIPSGIATRGISVPRRPSSGPRRRKSAACRTA